MKKILPVVFLLVLIVPSVAFASWWNPFSWKIFSFMSKKEIPIQTPTQASKIIETQKNEDKIIEKDNLTNDLNNKNNQLPSVPAKETTSTVKNISVDDTTNWRTYTNTTYNYQFKYPQADYYSEKDNTVILDSGDSKNVILKSETGLVSASIFSVKVISNINSTEQLKTLLDSEASPFESIQDTSKLETVNITIGGISGFKMTNNGFLNTAGFIKNKQAYIFKSYNEFKLEPYNNLLSTFKFIEPTETIQTKIINNTFSGIDCGRGKDNGTGNPQPEIDCFFTNMISCSNSKIILGKEANYADDILISVNKQNNSCFIKTETKDNMITCENKITKTEKEIKEKIESSKQASQQDRFLTVFGVPIILSDKITKGDSSCINIKK